MAIDLCKFQYKVSTLASILNILLHSNGTAKGLTMVHSYIYDHSLLLEERKTNIDDDRGLSRACRW